VPRENLLGEPEEGFKYLTQFLAQERLVAAIGSMAACQAAFDLTLEYITERRAFGKPIGAFQNSRFKMAEMRTQIDSAQAFIDQCGMASRPCRFFFVKTESWPAAPCRPGAASRTSW
jgi:acyl-CoA dehydrogenase